MTGTGTTGSDWTSLHLDPTRPRRRRLLNTPLGQRLGLHLHNWISISADPWVTSVVHGGYRWEFDFLPPLTTHPMVDSLPNSASMRLATSGLLDKLLDEGTIERVENTREPGFYSRWFAVPKKDPNTWRAILDLSTLNLFIKKEKFKMETAEIVRQQLARGEWMTSLDIKDAYHHIPIHPKFRRYLRFMYNGQVYQYCALPMGLSTACHTFNRMIKPIKAHFSSHGLHLHQYLDDWLLHHRDKQTLSKFTTAVVSVAQNLGFVVNRAKSELIPAQERTFLAYRFDLVHGLVRPTTERWEKIQSATRSVLTSSEMTAKTWQSLLGLLTATEKIVHLGMLHLRPLQRGLLDRWSPSRGDPQELIPITPTCKDALHWWQCHRNIMMGVPLKVAEPEVHIFTDSSKQGWGGHWENKEVSGLWLEHQTHWHINVLELLAIWYTLRDLLPLIDGKSVMVATDNATALAYIKKQGGTKSPTMLRVAQEFYDWLETTTIELRCRHIKGHLNVRADALSRRAKIPTTEWSLHPAIVKGLWRVWDTPMIDMFATSVNAKLPLYVSPMLDPGAIAVDALSIPWTGHLYMFPPAILLSKVLTKLQQEQCTVILIAPAWPTQSWFPTLLSLLVDLPLELPNWEKLLKQPGNVYHQQPDIFRLHAWRLSSNIRLREDFQRTLQNAWHEPRKNLASACIKQNGRSSWIGVLNGMPIHSRPLLL